MFFYVSVKPAGFMISMFFYVFLCFFYVGFLCFSMFFYVFYVFFYVFLCGILCFSMFFYVGDLNLAPINPLCLMGARFSSGLYPQV